MMDGIVTGKEVSKKALKRSTFLSNSNFLVSEIRDHSGCRQFFDSSLGVDEMKKNISEEISKLEIEIYLKSLKKLNKNEAVLLLSKDENQFEREVRIGLGDCRESFEKSGIKDVCSVLGGTFSAKKCIVLEDSESSEEESDTERKCFGIVKKSVKVLSKCQNEVVYECDPSKSCRKANPYCEAVFKGQAISFTGREKKSFKYMSTECAINEASKKKIKCEDNDGLGFECEWNQVCSVSELGEKCWAPRYSKCSNPEGMSWFCPTGLGSTEHLIRNKGGARQRPLSSVVEHFRKIKSQKYIDTMRDVFLNESVSKEQERLIEKSVCGKDHGVCL